MSSPPLPGLGLMSDISICLFLNPSTYLHLFQSPGTVLAPPGLLKVNASGQSQLCKDCRVEVIWALQLKIVYP